MSKSILYAVNQNSQSVSDGGTISFGSAVRRYGCNINVSGGDIVVKGQGYYAIDSNITVTAIGAGVGIITLYKDGVAIPGAVASFTAVASDIYSISIPAVVREICCCESTITAVLSGISGTVTNASILVEKE